MLLLALSIMNPAGALSAEIPARSDEVDPATWLSYSSNDGFFKLKPNAQLQIDGATFDQDRTPLSAAGEVRRARLGIDASFGRDWDFHVASDFSSDELDPKFIQDLYLRYSGFRPIEIRVGQFKEPISLESQRSSKYVTFMERALPLAFVPSYHLGIGAASHGDNWSAASGVFREGVQDGFGDSAGWGASARLTIAPLHASRKIVHFGLSSAYRVPDDASRSLRFRTHPESDLTDVYFINTHDMGDVGEHALVGMETAVVLGPWSLQGEYLHDFVHRDGGKADIDFYGWYAYSSWFLTGESRHYNAGRGAFGRLKPNRNFDLAGGIGAWELAVRYSTLNLNDSAIAGGREDNATLGLNWYPNTNLRLMANYVFVHVDEVTTGRHRHSSENPRVLQFRVQYEF